MAFQIGRLICFVLAFVTAPITNMCTPESDTQSAQPLPSFALAPSMKGYVLYSWQTQGNWNFALMVGTNALPAVAAITNGPHVIKNVDSLKAQLARIPKNDLISWSDDTLEGFHFEMPPKAIVQEVTRYCKKRGLDLQVSP